MTLNPVTGRPVKYSVLRHHPGDYFFPSLNPLEVDEIDARYVIHWFQKFRPGQVRGIPAFTPSLDLATELRAFRKAVLVGAQTAAEFAAVVENELGTANTDAEASYKPYQRVRIDRGQMVYLPPGTKMHQFDPKQPTTSYEMFQEKCLAEACRPLAYPLNLALGSSQKFNFSSAKLDHINYRESLSVERRECERVVLDKIFRAWFEEATLAGAVRKSDWRSPPHEWHWPGFASLDPKLDADTDHARLAGGTLTLRDFWASRGRDWREMLQHLADEKRQLERLGLTFGDVVTRSITDTVEDPSEAANAA
jgi:capsid protein